MNSRMTGHSLGGQITKHVNNLHKGRVKKNVVFSRGTGLLEPFHKKQNTVDMTNQHDLMSSGEGYKVVIKLWKPNMKVYLNCII